jgi:hypothetical protein
LSGIGGGEENDSSEKGSSTQSSKGLFGSSSSKKLGKLSMFLPFSTKSNTADEKSSTTGTETGAGTKTAKTGASSSYRFGLSFRLSIKEEEDDAASSVPSLSGKKSIEEKRSEIEVRRLLRLKKRGLFMGSKFWSEREQSYANIPLPELATPSSPRPEDVVSTLANRLHIDPFALEGDAADDDEAKEKRRMDKAEARRQLLESIEQLPDPQIRRVMMFRHSGHHSEDEINAFELSLVVQEDIKAKEKDKRTLVTLAGDRHIPPPKPTSPPPTLPQITIASSSLNTTLKQSP